MKFTESKRKVLVIGTIVALASACMVGCESEVVPKEEDLQVLQKNDVTGEIETEQELDVKGENFKLLVKYDTGRYDLNNWRVTDSKSVGMSVYTKGLPEGYEVYIDHVHADISLKATTAQVDGIMQDSMDDTYHGYNQDGFYIDDTNEYYNIFAIEGYTDQFYQLWGYAVGEYGNVSSSYERLTEGNLIGVGTYAEKLQVVYDLSIKTPEDEHSHTISVISEVLIPISQDANKNVKEVDILTGEVENED